MLELEHFVLSYRGLIYENEHFGDNVITLLDYIYIYIVFRKKWHNYSFMKMSILEITL